MFGKDFFPTPAHVIEQMLQCTVIDGKIVLEPSAGKGNIVDYLKDNGAKEVIGCEISQDLKKILADKCKVIADDFLAVKTEQISHINLIVMNPPFSADEKHILHAWEIAPAGCEIISLCNKNTIEKATFKDRKKLVQILREHGTSEELGQCFEEAERRTGVDVAMLRLTKPGQTYEQEFSGFFIEEDPEEEQYNGIMPYNVVRDLVNRYVAACKLFDEQLSLGVRMQELTSSFFDIDGKMSFRCTSEEQPVLKNDFKKMLQYSGWMFIFDKMNMDKYATRGLKEDINKFVEQQTNIPFTMRNIYKMIEIVIGTTSQRMDRAIIEVFDKLTIHYHDNRYNVEGWKTNSHYLMGKKFILPGMCPIDKWHTGNKINTSYGRYFDLVEDLVKALCFITGDSYETMGSLRNWIVYRFKVITNKEVYYHNWYNDHYDSVANKRKELYEEGVASEIVDSEPEYGQVFEWSYFTIRAYKKGTMHFEFKDEDVWARFNQRIAQIKGYPLPEFFENRTRKKK